MLKDTVHQLDYVMPVEWEKIYFHGDVINRFGVFYFYFNTKENKKYSYYNDIPKIYNVSEREYNERIENLYDAFLFLDDLFLEYKRTAVRIGYDNAESAPLVRSSYMAEQSFISMLVRKKKLEGKNKGERVKG